MRRRTNRERFGDRLRELRLERGLTQEKLAELAGIHRKHVGEVVRGLRIITLDNICALADAVRVPPEEMFRSQGLCPTLRIAFPEEVVPVSDSDVVRRLPFANEGALQAALREVADQVGLSEDFFQANGQPYDFDVEQFATLIMKLRRANVGARLWAQPTGDRASQVQITFPGPSTPGIRIHISGMAWTDLRSSLEVLGVECSDEVMESDEEAAERAARFAEGGPVDSVFEFIEAIQAGSFEGDVWPRISQDLRRVLVEAWLWANREELGLDPAVYPEDLVETVLSGPSARAVWQAFATTQAVELHTWADFDVTQYGASNLPRPVGSDCDLVLLINTRGQEVVYGQPTLVRAIEVLMRKEAESWRVAGFSKEIPQSGWGPVAPSGA